MKIEVIGPGRPFCKTLSKGVSENGIAAEIEHVTDQRAVFARLPRRICVLIGSKACDDTPRRE